MIRANISEVFPITVSLINENNEHVYGEIVKYDVRYIDDTKLVPPVEGILVESTVSSGIYKKNISINDSGSFLCYITCSGFPSSAEEIIINPENIYDIAKSNRHYNLSVEDVKRTNTTPTLSQLSRNVPLNRTDYVVNYIKRDTDSDWNSVVSSGIVYAHYKSVNDDVPYKMSGP